MSTPLINTRRRICHKALTSIWRITTIIAKQLIDWLIGVQRHVIQQQINAFYVQLNLLINTCIVVYYRKPLLSSCAMHHVVIWSSSTCMLMAVKGRSPFTTRTNVQRSSSLNDPKDATSLTFCRTELAICEWQVSRLQCIPIPDQITECTIAITRVF